MTEKWKTILNRKLKVGALFMDLSKAFDSLDHSLLLAKLSVHGLDNNSLSFVQSDLTNRFQRCKIKNDFSNFHEITTGVPQGSILGPFLFHIVINDVFLFIQSLNVCSFADDNTLVAFGKTFDEVNRKLQSDFSILGKWFFKNFLVLNSEKYHFITLGTPNTLPNFISKTITIKNNGFQKFLGIIIDNKLDFT